jgi:membrane protease YdiL (CAAX protease family)
MKKLYDKSNLCFSIIWIVAYVVLFSVADGLSEKTGYMKSITVLVGILLSTIIIIFLKKNNLLEKYGLCSFKGNLKSFLFFIPLLAILTVNLWNGVKMNTSIINTILFIISMVCVGFLEEIIFRGFLFVSMGQNSIKSAIIVSSITFGIGHIVNLLNGANFIPTLLQVFYAIAIGFLFTIMFYKSKSLIPCIIVHAVFNSLSIFSVENSSMTLDIITAVFLCVVSIGYALWILKKTKTIKIEN